MKKSVKTIFSFLFGIAVVSISHYAIGQESNPISTYSFHEEHTMNDDIMGPKKTRTMKKSTMLKMDPEAEASTAHFADLESYIKDHLVYPQLAKENGIEGHVRISFTILQNGEVNNPRVVQSLGTGCDKAAVELVENMPAWVPATKYGLPIGEKKYLDITFSLQ